MQDRADPHARERALAVASQDPPSGVTPDEAVAEIRDVLASIGDTCPECPPDCGQDTAHSSIALLASADVSAACEFFLC
jgi:hypothetical protein